MNLRNLAHDWRWVEKFCRKRGGRGVGRENLFLKYNHNSFEFREAKSSFGGQCKDFVESFLENSIAALSGLEDGREMP